ncbi:hypothetical protein K7I13_11200 [Brucepastera parasyntrophica]|nr:hypothetical protein [Brucepastera parasyntrophica]ULQ59071.1 hypothetical protein K7I13_11200 [Brucepastera parasyntrophica]
MLEFIKWFSMLSVSIVLQSYDNKLDENKVRKNIRMMFKSIMNGDKEIL